MECLCPICKANLIHTLIRGGKVVTELSSSRSVLKRKIITNRPQDEDIVECSKDKLHDIPMELQLDVIDLMPWLD